MSQVTSLDSIIHKYRDRLETETFSHRNTVSSGDTRSYSNFSNNNTIEASNRTSSSRQSFNLQNPQGSFDSQQIFLKYSKILSQNKKQYQSSEYEHEINNPNSNNNDNNSQNASKYQETLDLYYNQVCKNKSLSQHIQTLSHQINETESALNKIQNQRLSEKLQYANKLQILDKNYSTLNLNLQNELMQKIRDLENQVEVLEREESVLKCHIRQLEQQNRRLNNISGKIEEKEISFYNDLERGNMFVRNQSNCNYRCNQEDSMFESDDNSSVSDIKLNYQKLQQQSELIIDQNIYLKEQILKLSNRIQQYKQRINELQQKHNISKNSKLLYSPQSVLGKTLKRRDQDSYILTAPSVSESEIENHSHNLKGKPVDVETKLKKLEKQYEKLSSQMLTVESAKRIAKQTSKYYFNKRQ